MIDSALIGFRVWRITAKGLLRSFTLRPGIWPTDAPRRAMCFWGFFLPHYAPEVKCSCGLYAYKTPNPVLSSLAQDRYQKSVWGVVQLWGRIVIHEDGYRAEYARPLALQGTTPEVKALAARYGISAVVDLNNWR